MKNSKKKILALVLVMLLLSVPILSVQGLEIGGLARSVLSPSNVKTYGFLVWLTVIVKYSSDHYYSHLRDYVVINPNPAHPEIRRVMGFFISLAIAFYFVAIPLTGFYLLFVSGSARGRAKAKYTLGKLIIGMFFVSISPYLIELLFQFSGSLTGAILDQGDIGIVAEEFNNVLWGGYKGTAVILAPGLLNVFAAPEGLAGIGALTGGIMGAGADASVGTLIGQGALKGVRWSGGGAVAIALYPYFLIIVLVMLTFGFLAGRYLTLIIWTILFPLSIFLTSFDPTKYIGRVMMEQTFQWTFLQVFYALTLVGMSIGLVLLPEGYKGYGIFFTAFHSIAVIAWLFLGPWYLSSLLQKLFPP